MNSNETRFMAEAQRLYPDLPWREQRRVARAMFNNSRETRLFRADMLLRDGFRCQHDPTRSGRVCGRPAQELHHLHYGFDFENRGEAVTAMCSACHAYEGGFQATCPCVFETAPAVGLPPNGTENVATPRPLRVTDVILGDVATRE